MHNPAFTAHDEMRVSQKLRVESKIYGGVLAPFAFPAYFPGLATVVVFV